MDVTTPVSTGTTLVCVTCEAGVVLGADSRTSSGVYVANRASAKITQLTEGIYVCRSGSAADTQAVAAAVQHALSAHEIEAGETASVVTAGTLVQNVLYNNKSMLMAACIVGGWDKYEGGQLFSLPLGGTIVKVPYATSGSGSAYIAGFLEKHFRTGMSMEEAQQLVKRAIAHACARDGSSGGCIRLISISKEGEKRDFFPVYEQPGCYGEIDLPAFTAFEAAS